MLQHPRITSESLGHYLKSTEHAYFHPTSYFIFFICRYSVLFQYTKVFISIYFARDVIDSFRFPLDSISFYRILSDSYRFAQFSSDTIGFLSLSCDTFSHPYLLSSTVIHTNFAHTRRSRDPTNYHRTDSMTGDSQN